MSVNKKHESRIIKYIIAEANNMLINHISVIQNKTIIRKYFSDCLGFLCDL